MTYNDALHARKPAFRIIDVLTLIYGILLSCLFLATLFILIFGETSPLGFNIGLLSLAISWSGLLLLLYVIVKNRRPALRRKRYIAILMVASLLPLVCLLFPQLFEGIRDATFENIGVTLIYFVPVLISLIFFGLFLLEKDAE